MSTRTLGILVGLLIVLGVAYVVANHIASEQRAPDQPQKVVYTWQLTQLPENPDTGGAPHTRVELIVGDKSYPVGEYQGSCAEIDGTSWTLADGEKTGVICWWAGGGNDIGIFDESGQTVVKEGQLDEGDAETPGFRGNYKTLIQI